jgi:hypothetical protein
MMLNARPCGGSTLHAQLDGPARTPRGAQVTKTPGSKAGSMKLVSRMTTMAAHNARPAGHCPA